MLSHCTTRLAICGAIGLVGLIMLSSTVIHAWVLAKTGCPQPLRWENSQTTMLISTESFPPNSWWDVELQAAMWQWNDVAGSEFNFLMDGGTDGDYPNGSNEIYLSDSPSIFDDDVLAVTRKAHRPCWDGGDLAETDILFNKDKEWTRNWPTTDEYNFGIVALHELGHALGLAHEDKVMATMNTFYPNGGPVGNDNDSTPLGDDRQGVRHLYPDSTTERDIAASALQYFKTSKGEATALPSKPNKTTVKRGGTVTIDFTVMNLGTSRETYTIGFYLSASDYITTTDFRIASNSGAWSDPGFAGTFSRALKIPSWVPPGSYYLGFIVDYKNEIPERDERNNGVALQQRIRIK